MEHEKIKDGIAPVRFDQLERCAEVIRESFATVAEEFGITEQNCPNHTRFIKTERLEKEFATGYLLYGYYKNGKIIGFAALSDAGGTAYELHHITVLPEYRHKGIGKKILDFCVKKVRECGGKKIILSMIEENTRIKEMFLNGNRNKIQYKLFLYRENIMADNYFASVGAIVLRDNKILLVRHTYGAAAGKLLNPGGYIQKGELPFDAVKREIFEETGVTVEPVGMLSVRCAPNGWYMVCLADYISGEPESDGKENSEALFMDCTELLSRPDATDTVKTLLRLALSVKPLAPIDAGDRRVMFAGGHEI